jgi:hypothetical protein
MMNLSMLLITLTIFCFLFNNNVNASTPEPDNSEQCLSCQTEINDLDLKWTNETNVELILEDLTQQCKQKPLKQRKICEKIVEIYVQIPPGIFEGLSTLAWPIPLATCATFRKCEVRCCGADSPPEQVHLSLASTDRSIMGVSWATLNQNVSIVQYGTDQNNLDLISQGSVLTYPSAGWIGSLHRATMISLLPTTTYYYRVGDGVNSWSEIFNFKTFDPASKSITYAVIADMAYDNISDDTVSVLKEMVADGKIDVVIHSGDISYADGYEPHWDNFLNKVQDIAAHIPYMVVPGNHEFWYNFTAYKSRFFMPGTLEEGGSGDNMYYMWQYGFTHFLAMNSETAIDTPMFTDQEMDWVNKDLTTVNRENTPWLISHFHRVMYCTSGDCKGSAGQILRDKAEDVFYNAGVDVVIQGHVHTYERSYPMYQNVSTQHDYVSPKAPVYILQGASGNREGNKGAYPPQDQLPEWSAAQHNDVGFGLMTVSSNTLEWSFYNSSTGLIIDSMTITK